MEHFKATTKHPSILKQTIVGNILTGYFNQKVQKTRINVTK